MKRLVTIGLLFLSLQVIVYPQVRRQSPMQASNDRTAVENLLQDYIQANTEFYHSRDTESILKFYSPSYVEVSNGEVRRFDDVRSMWTGLKEKLDLGSTERRAITITDKPQINVSGTVAFVIFSFTDKVGSGGRLLRQTSGTCTEVLFKTNGRWLIEHEHCSTEPQTSETVGRSSNDNVELAPIETPTQPTTSRQQRLTPPTFVVAPGRYSFFPIVGSNRDLRVYGDFRAAGGSGNNIDVFILDADGFENFRNGNRSNTYYNSGRATVGNINVRLRPGNYYLVFNNGFSTISNKAITANIFVEN